MLKPWVTYTGRITIDSTNNTVFVDGDSEDLTPGEYYVIGDGSAQDIVGALASLIDGLAGIVTTGSVDFLTSPDGPSARVTFQMQSAADLEWSSGTFDATVIGFTGDSTGTDEHVSDVTPSRVWTSDQPVEVADFGMQDLQQTQLKTRDGTIYTNGRGNEIETQKHAFKYCHEKAVIRKRNAADPARTHQQWRASMVPGIPFRVYHGDESSGTLTNLTLDDTYVLQPMKWSPRRDSPGNPRYAWSTTLGVFK